MALAAEPAERPSARDEMAPVAYRVTSRTRETEDTVTIGIVPVTESIPTPAAGQFCMLYAPRVGEVPISVSGVEASQSRLLHTIRAVGAVTKALCALDVGDVVGVRGPYGTAWGVEAAAGGDLLLVAGGIGLAPLRPVVHEVLRRRRRFRRVTLLVGARSPDEMVFRGEIASWQASARMEVRTTVDYATAAWKGDVGVVTTLIERLTIDPEVTVAMVCGPEVMMRFAAAGVMAQGVAPQRVLASLERTMQCGIRRCGHCQLGGLFICSEGPVLPWSRVAPLLARREL